MEKSGFMFFMLNCGQRRKLQDKKQCFPLHRVLPKDSDCCLIPFVSYYCSILIYSFQIEYERYEAL